MHEIVILRYHHVYVVRFPSSGRVSRPPLPINTGFFRVIFILIMRGAIRNLGAAPGMAVSLTIVLKTFASLYQSSLLIHGDSIDWMSICNA